MTRETRPGRFSRNMMRKQNVSADHLPAWPRETCVAHRIPDAAAADAR
jgi:hypothetical protein